MYDKERRKQFSTIGELKALLNDISDNTKVVICGDDFCWFHVEQDESVICLDTEDLEEDYAEIPAIYVVAVPNKIDNKLHYIHSSDGSTLFNLHLMRTFASQDSAWKFIEDNKERLKKEYGDLFDIDRMHVREVPYV